MDNLLRDLEHTWAHDGRSADAIAALSRWTTTRPGLTSYSTPADLVAAAHSRRDAVAVRLVEDLTAEAPSDRWAARTVLHALLPGLGALARLRRNLVGPGEPFDSIRELDQFIVCAALERIAQVFASPTTAFGLHDILASTTRRLRTHVAGHRRERHARAPLDAAAARVAPPARTAAEELAAVLVDAVERGLLRPVDAGLVYTTRVVGQAPADLAASLAWRTPSLVRRRHRVEQVLAADALGQTKPRGCYVAAACG